MSKVTEWRRECPKSVLENQIYALESEGFFLIRQNGPLAFSVQEMDKLHPFEIRLGDPHRCTCKWYLKKHDLCTHICWIILKKLRISVHNSVSFQLGMSAQELRNCVHGKLQSSKLAKPRILAETLTSATKDSVVNAVQRRSQSTKDNCPICLDSYSSMTLVIYCKFGCGNAIHAKCMSMLVRYRENETSSLDIAAPEDGTMITCPLCRGHFDTLCGLKKQIRLSSNKDGKQQPEPVQIHQFACRFCKMKPIRGNLYRCLECDQVILCGLCLSNMDFQIFHGRHCYAIKEKPNDVWKRLGKVQEKWKSFTRNNLLHNEGLQRKAAGEAGKFTKTTAKSGLLKFSKELPYNCRRRTGPLQPQPQPRPFLRLPATITKPNHRLETTIINKKSFSNLATRVHEPHSQHLFFISINETKTQEQQQQDLCLPEAFIRLDDVKSTSKIQRQSRVEELCRSPLEIRVSRMHLEDRSSKGVTNRPVQGDPKNKSPNITFKKLRSNKCPKIKSKAKSFELDEQSLSSQVNPLMTILMTPHLRNLIDPEEKTAPATTTNRKLLRQIKVKSLDFQDDMSCHQGPRCKFTPQINSAAQRTFQRSKSSTAATTQCAAFN